jgi:general secretion pathway protein E
MAQTVEQLDDLRDRPADEAFVARVPIGFARQHAILALASDNGRLAVAIADAAGLDQADAVGRLLDRRVRPVFVPRRAILAAINVAYGEQKVEVDRVLDAMDRDSVLAEIQHLATHEDLLDTGHRAPVIRLANLILFEAVKQLASDVHIQPYENRLVVRYRLDGVLFNAFDLPKAVQDEMISRMKVMGQMDIAEKRLPQDGRATVHLGDRVIDLRIASLPTSYGERVVIRLLDKSARLYRLDELGMNASTLGRFRDLIAVEHGLILVTGPTGSGKSTTLYGALLELDSLEHNILTLEDPIEYQLPGISQTQVNTRKGLTFAQGLRNVLRQDPDIIMVGEIRDHETATMAIQSALTGHLVFSTLHTNDSASAVTRLLDLGIEPYLVASSLVGVLAQRLVRRVCGDCRAAVELTDGELTRLGVDPRLIATRQQWRGRGCSRCRGTGYRGRVGIFEQLVIDDHVRSLVTQRATAAEMNRQSLAAGMKTLRDDGLAKIEAGITTTDEVVRATAPARGGFVLT